MTAYLNACDKACWLATCLMLAATTAQGAGSGAAREEPQVLGWLEDVTLDPERVIHMKAKLDTGADTSSLDAVVVKRFRRGGKRYVRFEIDDPATGEPVLLVKPYVRRVRIKRHNGEHQRRVVVRMSVCVGARERSIEVNLVERDEFDYPLLLGRSALEGIALVDPARSFTTEPSCWQPGVEESAADPAASAPRERVEVPSDNGRDGG